MAKTLMIQGTSSNVGKSLISAALCRIFHRRGVSVVPFKAQNMALNSFVTPEGDEIGRAQVVQAFAAGLEPHVDMNPVLLKPEADALSQVVLMGKPWKRLPAGSYYKEHDTLWSAVAGALARLGEKYELIIIEGAGSPAEINLNRFEIVNMSVARHLNSPVLLAGDIDRGGIFAQLYGTLELLEPADRELVKGFIINKFRGDIKLLEPGLGMLAGLTGGVPTLGVLPYVKDILLAQEDSVFLDETCGPAGNAAAQGIDIVVIRLPHISNYDDFDPLVNESGVTVRFADSVKALGYPDAVIIPGSKTTIADLRWLAETGLADSIAGLRKSGIAISGICGGFQMLGRLVNDPDGVEGSPGRTGGLGLIAAETVITGVKKTVAGSMKPAAPVGFMAKLGEEPLSGYEIHMGRTVLAEGSEPLLIDANGSFDGGISSDGLVWGTYLHGIFDNDGFRHSWLGSLGWNGEQGSSFVMKREEEMERLADIFEASIDLPAIESITGL